MAKALTHIALHVKDVEESTAFYKEWCGMEVVHSRATEGGDEVRWLASPGQEEHFVIVLVPGGAENNLPSPQDIGHLGFAVESEQELKDIFNKASAAGNVYWQYQEHEYPVGSLFSMKDPDGNVIEFSYGQPLGEFKDKADDPQGPHKPQGPVI